VSIECLKVDGKRSRRFGPFDSFSCMDGMHWAILVIEATS
jgi:hypothetical protein